MTFQVGRKKTGGRSAGTPNKSTYLLKEAILKAFEERGGIEYLKQLPDNLFVQLLGKVLPRNSSTELLDNFEPVQFYIRGISDPESSKYQQKALD